jgi:hypothetical protein
MASQIHQHMDDTAWQRFNYFLATNGLLVAALATLSETSDDGASLLVRLVAMVIPAMGLVYLPYGSAYKGEGSTTRSTESNRPSNVNRISRLTANEYSASTKKISTSRNS